MIFFITEPFHLECLTSFNTLLCLFMSVHVPVVMSKILVPSQVLEIMGIELDSTCMEAQLPADKLQHTWELLNSFTKHCVICLVELESLVPGRTFLQHRVNSTRGQPFHNIHLNKAFFKDLTMWKIFLWVGTGILSFLIPVTLLLPLRTWT